jgi:hypothetical protein
MISLFLTLRYVRKQWLRKGVTLLKLHWVYQFIYIKRLKERVNILVSLNVCQFIYLF